LQYYGVSNPGPLAVVNLITEAGRLEFGADFTLEGRTLGKAEAARLQARFDEAARIEGRKAAEAAK
jgi:hypothetical protein